MSSCRATNANQTGLSDDEASTFDTFEEADQAESDLVATTNDAMGVKFRVVEIEEVA